MSTKVSRIVAAQPRPVKHRRVHKKSTNLPVRSGGQHDPLSSFTVPDSRHVDLRKLRAALGVAQPVMGELIGVSTRQISAFETQRVRPNQQTRRALTELVRLQKALSEIMQPDAIGEWLDTPNRAFADLRPRDVIVRGEADRIWQMVFYLSAGMPT